ncbi:MAG: type II secretion system F family protein [Nanoarchaeota archaeon]|nr:type II secretion system F family protein [Nanoarchaeota archaeon]
MVSNIQQTSKRINELTQEIKSVQVYKERFLKQLKELDSQLSSGGITKLEHRRKLASLLKGKTNKEALNYYNVTLSNSYNEIKADISQIYKIIQPEKSTYIQFRGSKREKELPKTEKHLFAGKKSEIQGEFALSKEKEKLYMAELNIKEEDIKKFIKSQKKDSPKSSVLAEYTVYKTNPYSKMANTYLENVSFKLTKKYPQLLEPLFEALKLANIKLLSKTYLSIILFSTILAFPIAGILTFILTLSILKTILYAFLGSILTLFLLYAYPFSVINGRRKKIKNELVFAIVHMAAVAGSGAKPTRIFKLLADSKEYTELEPELRKILNYMNIFGYSLTTSLRAASETTPSPEFKELLNGIISTVETGGDIKRYLSDKADDALNRYRLDQTKYLSAISAYSDIYTGILIAAPLLFVVILAIIEKISPDFGTMTVNTIASIGTFVLLPFLNIAFILFLEITKSDI